MASEKKAVAEAATKQDVELKGVIISYIDKPDRLSRVFEQRKAAGLIDNKGNLFVHMSIKYQGGEYNGLSQTLRVLGKADYEALLKAYEEQSPIDIVIRKDEVSLKTGNCFFFVSHGEVKVDDLFNEPFDKPTVDRHPAIDLLG